MVYGEIGDGEISYKVLEIIYQVEGQAMVVRVWGRL